MKAINPWINFNGNAEEAFTFYKSVFGGEFTKMVRFRDIATPEFPVSENEAHKIMLIALPIGRNNVLMANDVPESMGPTNENENRSKISINAESRAEADRIFNGLSQGGSIEGPLGDTPWGSYAGMFRDKYGIEWIVEYDSKNIGENVPQNKSTPALWFHTDDGKMNQVTDYYSKIFDANFTAANPWPLGETPSGYAEMTNIQIFGQGYLFMTTALEHHTFNDSFAIMIHCKDQGEIDKYWDYFTQDGEESMCGWCIYRFGQVIPENIGELMSKPNAWEVMSKQKKIVIAEYIK